MGKRGQADRQAGMDASRPEHKLNSEHTQLTQLAFPLLPSRYYARLTGARTATHLHCLRTCTATDGRMHCMHIFTFIHIHFISIHVYSKIISFILIYIISSPTFAARMAPFEGASLLCSRFFRAHFMYTRQHTAAGTSTHTLQPHHTLAAFEH